MKKSIILLISISFFFSCKTASISESDKKLIILELERINSIDQEYAGIPSNQLIEKYGNEKAWEIYEGKRDSIGLLNQLKIKDLFEKYGYLGYKEVGEKASNDFWISIQHADNDVEFQKKMLTALKKEMLKNNASKIDYAMLEDRVNVNLDRKQRFGTQVTYNNEGQAIPKKGLMDSTNIEQIRKKFDLPGFLEYYNRMTTNHFEMNKKFFKEKGIFKPKLYK